MPRPIVLCGLGRMGWRVLDYLRAAGLPVVIVDTVCQPDDPRLAGARLVRGDCRRREVLEQAGVADARGVLILTADDLVNVSTALVARGLNRDVRVVLRMFNQNLLGRLGKAVNNVFALSTSLLTAPILALAALTGQALGTVRLDDSKTGLRQLAELHVGPASPLRGQSIHAVTHARDLVAVAFVRGDEQRFLLDVSPDTALEAGDHLVLYGEPGALKPLLGTEEDEAELRYGGAVRRFSRVAYRTLAEFDLAVVICTAVLVAVVAVSTVVLSLSVDKYAVPQAFLRSVSIIATGAALGEDDFKEAPYAQVYVSVLRIIGAVLMAAFTAIVTNYLLRAQIGGALEVRRIPESGHVVVCGLSTVGFRVTEELLRLGERVVIIEIDPSNRFVTTARRLGAVVLIGDAAVLEVLRQARAGAARAVVPATNNDMINLEVALLVRELDAAKRVVLLLNDPQFAAMLREAANVRLAVSVPALAAPAFVAGLFGDRVASVFLMRERLFAILDLVIHDDDPLAGQSLRAVAVDHRVLPVGLVREKGPPPRPILTGRLAVGDRVLAIIALADLERLLRRQPASAAYTVEVTSCPLPSRGWLAGLLRATAGMSAEDADRAAAALPTRLPGHLTRGQAEDLLAQLGRERVGARLVGLDETS